MCWEPTPRRCWQSTGLDSRGFSRDLASPLYATGLRIGELLALRWSALDLDAGTLAVRESVFEGTFQPLKTARAQRTIPLGPRAVKALAAHRARYVRLEPDAW